MTGSSLKTNVPEHKYKPRVVIAGAGIGGLAAALALLRAGFDVDVYEQASELREIGAGVQVSANGTCVLFALGLEAPVRRLGVQAADKEIRLWDSGQTWSIFDRLGPSSVQRYGYPMFLLHRGDVHSMLVAGVRALKPDAIHVNHKVAGFEQYGEGVKLLFEGGGPASGDVLIGADGLHSRIRAQLFGPAVANFTGTIAWRGMVPIEKLSGHNRRSIATNWLGPGAHATCYPVRDGELFNFVGQVDRAGWEVESWIEEGSVDECLADFPGWHADVVDTIKKTDKLYKWAIFLREPLPRWSAGAVTLLGDACHAMVPYLGQGANMALEDGLVLARCLQASPDDVVTALRRYEAARVERTTRVVQGSTDMIAKFHNAALASPDTAASYINANWHPDSVRGRYDWIYEYDSTRVAV